jgi:hypothetical protein
MAYIYQIGVYESDGVYIPIKERYAVEDTLELVRKDARKLLDKLDSGIVLIVDGDYVEQIGDYDGDVSDMIAEIDEKMDKGDSYII